MDALQEVLCRNIRTQEKIKIAFSVRVEEFRQRHVCLDSKGGISQDRDCEIASVTCQCRVQFMIVCVTVKEVSGPEIVLCRRGNTEGQCCEYDVDKSFHCKCIFNYSFKLKSYVTPLGRQMEISVS